jgi:hypothetical protein
LRGTKYVPQTKINDSNHCSRLASEAVLDR